MIKLQLSDRRIMLAAMFAHEKKEEESRRVNTFSLDQHDSNSAAD